MVELNPWKDLGDSMRVVVSEEKNGVPVTGDFTRGAFHQRLKTFYQLHLL